MLAGLAAAGLMAGASLASSYMSSSSAEDVARYNALTAEKMTRLQHDLSREDYEYSALQGPSLLRQGYESAGLNPLLSTGSVSPTWGSTSAASVPGRQPASIDIAGAVSSALQAYGALKDDSRADLLTEARAARELASAQRIETDIDRIAADTKLKAYALKNPKLSLVQELKDAFGDGGVLGNFVQNTAEKAFTNWYRLKESMPSSVINILNKLGDGRHDPIDSALDLFEAPKSNNKKEYDR